MKSFVVERRTPKPADALLPEVVTGLNGPLAGAGYVLQTQGDGVLTYARKYRPWFIWALVVAVFPIGLLFLLYSETATITVVLKPEASSTLVTVTGNGEASVQKAFWRMQL